MGEGLGRREAPAEIRQMARVLRDMFAALVQEGFTEQQALIIIGTVIASNPGKQG